MPEGTDDADSNELDTFTRVFGVSEADLKRNGVDVSEYVRKHATKAVRNEKKMAFIWAKAPQSDQARHQSVIWGLRCFYLMFATLAVLLLSTFKALSPLRDVFLSLAVVGLVCVLFSLVRYYRLFYQSRRLKRSGN